MQTCHICGFAVCSLLCADNSDLFVCSDCDRAFCKDTCLRDAIANKAHCDCDFCYTDLVETFWKSHPHTTICDDDDKEDDTWSDDNTESCDETDGAEEEDAWTDDNRNTNNEELFLTEEIQNGKEEI